MFRAALIAVTAMLALALTGTAYADNVSDMAAEEVGDGFVDKSLNATGNHFAAVYLCTGGGTPAFQSVQVSDCCIVGDGWRAIIHKKRSVGTFPFPPLGDLFNVTGNVSNATADGGAFAPGVFSPAASLPSTGNTVIFAMGSDAPGGLPAGGTGRINSAVGKGNPVCKLRNVVNGTASP